MEFSKSALISRFSFLGKFLYTLVCGSILSIRDGKHEERGSLISYFRAQAEKNNEGFFKYCIRNINFFLSNDPQEVAYTNIEKRIFINYPNTYIISSESLTAKKQWYFIFCHECLHQFWDTFKIGDKIIKEKGFCDHELLNICSDCVINDYLSEVKPEGKKMPSKLITPEVIKKAYGVDYDRAIDTQYSLYNKCIKQLSEDDLDDLKKKFGDKITPKEIRKQPAPPQGPTPPPPPAPKFPKPYVEGYVQAAKDYNEGKLDLSDNFNIDNIDIPQDYKNDKEKSALYKRGYDAARKLIKKAVEDGIDIVEQPGTQNPGGKSNLPQILKIPNNNQGAGGDGSDGDDDDPEQNAQDADESAKEAQENAKEAKKIADDLAKSGNKEAADKAQEAADKAQEAADKAQEAADKAREAAKNGDSNGAKNGASLAKSNLDASRDALNKAKEQISNPNSNAKTAKKDADKARKLAEQAQSIADKLKGNNSSEADKAQDAANKAKEAADRAQSAANKAESAASHGDSSTAKAEAANASRELDNAIKELEKAKSENAKANSKANTDNTDNSAKNKSENDENKINNIPEAEGFTEEELRDFISNIAKNTEAQIEIESKMTVGGLSDFAKKCQSSKKLEATGLSMNSFNGKKGKWDNTVKIEAQKYLNNKVREPRQFEKTYSRRDRRDTRSPGEIRRQMQSGTYIPRKGNKEIKQKIGFDINVFIDISTSMSDCINEVFKKAYSITEDLKNIFGHNTNVDKNKIQLGAYVFNTKMTKIPYGSKHRVQGGTYQFHELINDINKNGVSAFLNIIVTDGCFSTVNNSAIIDSFEEMEGLVVLVTCSQVGTFDDLEDELQRKFKGVRKLLVVYTDEKFENEQ